MKPKFIDQARIHVKAGNGGDGHVGFRREKYVPKGGPDGGDGGSGGNVLLVGSLHKTTLQDFQYKRHFYAEEGKKGGRAQRTGPTGEDLIIEVPLGTILLEDSSGKVLGEVTKEGETIVLSQGGTGGLGNPHFATSTNRAPQKATPGEVTEAKWIRLELRLLADIGIVGLPNAGKSTLLGQWTAAKPKVGDYPFTTLSPSLGVLREGDRSLTLADIPGLIEGAHQGVGLGHEFLRHIKRTKGLLFLVAGDGGNSDNVWQNYRVTLQELKQYDEELTKRTSWIVLNKIDLLDSTDVDQIRETFRLHDQEIWPISAKDGTGLEELKHALFSTV